MLQKISPHTLATEITNAEIRQRLDIKKDVTQLIMERKLKLFGHICRMDDNRLVKNLVFRIIDGLNRRGRPRREWMDDIKEWCRTDAQTLSIIAQDCSEWRLVVMETLDTNGRKPVYINVYEYDVYTALQKVARRCTRAYQLLTRSPRGPKFPTTYKPHTSHRINTAQVASYSLGLRTVYTAVLVLPSAFNSELYHVAPWRV